LNQYSLYKAVQGLLPDNLQTKIKKTSNKVFIFSLTL